MSLIINICEYKYLCREKLEKLILTNPDSFTPWFKLIYAKVLRMIKNNIYDY